MDFNRAEPCFAITLLREREREKKRERKREGSWLLCRIVFLCPFIAVLWISMWYVTVVFTDHTHWLTV